MNRYKKRDLEDQTRRRIKIATATPDSWSELVLIGVTQENGTEKQFAALTEDITAMDWGEKEIDIVDLVDGGKVVHKVPMTEETMTLKMWPITANTDGTGVVQFFHPQSTADTTDPILVENTNNRRRHKVVLLWATLLPAAASTVPAINEKSYRIQIINAYMTRYVPNYDDKRFSCEVSFKWAPFQKDRTVGNKREESNLTAGTALPAATTSVTAWA